MTTVMEKSIELKSYIDNYGEKSDVGIEMIYDIFLERLFENLEGKLDEQYLEELSELEEEQLDDFLGSKIDNYEIMLDEIYSELRGEFEEDMGK